MLEYFSNFVSSTKTKSSNKMDFLVNIREVIAEKTHDYVCYGEDDFDIDVVITNTPTQLPMLQMPLKQAIVFLQSEVAKQIELQYSTVYARFEIVLTEKHTVEQNSPHFFFDNPYQSIVDMITRWKLELLTIS